MNVFKKTKGGPFVDEGNINHLIVIEDVQQSINLIPINCNVILNTPELSESFHENYNKLKSDM